jgi:uncharacterized protein YcbK (DUF882 family)
MPLSDVSRRKFVTMVGAALPVLVAPSEVFAWAAKAATSTCRELKFAHTHTGEKLAVEYFSGGHYVPDALKEINKLLRDFRTSEIHAMDPGLLDLLYGLNGVTESSKPFQVISGYRSPKTNAMLRSKSERVASSSLHMKGQAIDIRLADVPLAKLRTAAQSLRRGGVGYYPASDFVHVDTGRVRTW